MPFGGLLTVGLIAAGGSIGGALIGSSASKSAAQQQTAQEDKALQFQEQEYGDQKANEAPFVSAGQTSLAQLLKLTQDGFQAPTLAEAQQTPGYQFTQQQGEQGIERGQAAAGGAFTGGTLKALAGFDTNLADSTYQQIFANAMQAYQTHFNSLASVAGLGQNAAANAGNTGAQISNTIGNTLTNIGATEAAGTVGSANALASGINGAVSSAQLPFYLQYLNPNSVAPTPAGWNGSGINATPPSQSYVAPEVTLPSLPYIPDAG